MGWPCMVVQFSFSSHQMCERRVWTAQQDELLRMVFQTSLLRKWSHMARRLEEEFGVKGRNGKQCRQRYLSCIDGSLKREEWTVEEEQRLMQLHNQIGNKWAIIGSTIGGRTDNAVKNHFYCRLRKGLKKINTALLASQGKLGKEFKPNILYRLVEVAEEIFRASPNFQKQFSAFSNQLKNDLFELAYDDEVEEREGDLDEEQAKDLIGRLGQFIAGYKRKPKKQRRASQSNGQVLLAARCQSRSAHQIEESDPNSLQPSSETSNFEGNHEDRLFPYQQQPTRTRRCSESTSTNFLMPDRIRTRANSQGIVPALPYEPPAESDHSKLTGQAASLQRALQGLQIMEVQAILPAYPPLMLRRDSSAFSRGEEEEFRFFEDSQIELRILPEVDYSYRRESHEDNIFF